MREATPWPQPTQLCTGGRCLHWEGREESPVWAALPCGPGDRSCTVRPTQHHPGVGWAPSPTTALRLHHLSFCTQHTEAIRFPRNTTDFIFARFPASLAFQKVPSWGGSIYPRGTEHCSLRVLRAGPWRARGKQNPNRRGPGLVAAVHAHSQMEPECHPCCVP